MEMGHFAVGKQSGSLVNMLELRNKLMSTYSTIFTILPTTK